MPADTPMMPLRYAMADAAAAIDTPCLPDDIAAIADFRWLLMLLPYASRHFYAITLMLPLAFAT